MFSGLEVDDLSLCGWMDEEFPLPFECIEKEWFGSSSVFNALKVVQAIGPTKQKNLQAYAKLSVQYNPADYLSSQLKSLPPKPSTPTFFSPSQVNLISNESIVDVDGKSIKGRTF